jgi:glycosyltransferase involved in cell wall biosynthesis
MRLLFLTETIPFPLDSGGRIKTYNTIRLLSRRHEVHCHALVRDAAHLSYEQDLAPHCTRLTLHYVPRTKRTELAAVAWSQLARQPFVVRRHFHAPVLRQLRALCRQQAFDAVYCDHLSMLEYGRRLHLPIVLDAHNVEFAIVRRHAATMGWSPLRMPAELEWRRLRRYERRRYRECRLIYSVSATDAEVVRDMAGDGPHIAVLPIAVDVAAAPVVAPLTAAPEMLFVGGLHWPPNADAVSYFVREVLPLVRRAVPGARLTVVGKRPETIARRLGRTDGLRFTGHVGDVEPWFQASRVMVVPIRSGSGMRVKILDGLARGLPIVTTAIGCEGIDASDGTDLLVADTADDFARQVVRVLQDRPLAEALALSGRQLARRRYDVSAIDGALNDALAHTFIDTRNREPLHAAEVRARSPL